MQTTIYFVRHGEVKNPKEILYSRLPRFGMTKRGKAEIAQTADFFVNKNIDLIYSSPLFRARQTAQIIAEKINVFPIHYTDYLTEVLTSNQGKPLSYLHTIDFAYPDLTNNITGESIEDVARRTEKFITKVSKQYPGKNIVATTHGDVLMIIKAVIEKLPLELNSIRQHGKYVKHGEVYAVRCENGELLGIKSVFKPETKSF